MIEFFERTETRTNSPNAGGARLYAGGARLYAGEVRLYDGGAQLYAEERGYMTH
jgi:hypothetical protein